MRYTVLYCCLLFTTSLLAQNDISIADWRTHLPFNRVVSVTQSDEKVYYGAQQQVVVIDKEERSIELLDRVNGLSDVEIQVIKYYEPLDILLVAYKNSNIDVIKEGKITNIEDIKRFSLINDKTINSIHFSGNFAYLSCAFGVVELDLENLEVKATFQTDGINTNATYVINDTIFIATDEGIYQGNRSLNLQDFNNWEKHSFDKHLQDFYFSNVLELFDDRLFADVNDTLMYYQNGTWNHFPKIQSGDTIPYFLLPLSSIRDLSANESRGQMMITTNFNVGYIKPNGFVFLFFSSDFISSPQQTIEDATGKYWYADLNVGAYLIDDFEISQININGPFSNRVSELAIYNNKLYVASGGVNDRWQANGLRDGFFVLEEGTWTNYKNSNTPELGDVRDYLAIAAHPNNEKIYVGTYRGLVELDGDEVTVFNQDNSTLQSPPLDPSSVRVGGLVFDDNNNLWITNYEAPQPLSVLKSDGSWVSLGFAESLSQVDQIVIDRNNYKWIVNTRENGIIVYNDNGTIDNPSDDRVVHLTTANSELPTNTVNCVEVDQDGDIWVGTSEGTVVFECSGQLFTEGCTGRKVIVEEDDFGAHLLATENVTTIASDGADRKWFGTDNGIFVQSSNGEETIFRFTEDNSPLLSNKVIDIVINPVDGEVFIGTEQGIISYRSDAVTGGNTHSTDAYVFPNPVRPDYDGPIAITGLVEDARVKITDISGTMIYETTALGGQAIWNGRDYNGNKAASGVYLVFSAKRDGLDNLVTKLLFLK